MKGGGHMSADRLIMVQRGALRSPFVFPGNP